MNSHSQFIFLIKLFFEIFSLKFLKGGEEEDELERDQFVCLANILNQNKYSKKIKLDLFEKNKIISENSKKFNFRKFMLYFSVKEVEFFDFIKLVFSNEKI